MAWEFVKVSKCTTVQWCAVTSCKRAACEQQLVQWQHGQQAAAADEAAGSPSHPGGDQQ
jgi:hypothetical protein